MTAFADLKANGVSAAHAALSDRNDHALLAGHVREWMIETKDVYRGNRSKVAEHPATALLAEKLETLGLIEVGSHLRQFAEETGPIHPGIWLFALLLGQANAELLVECLSKQEWHEANFWGHDSFGAWDAYRDAIVCMLVADERWRTAAWAFVDQSVEETRADPSIYIFPSGDRATGLARDFEDYATKPRIKEAWETRLDAHVHFTHAFFLKILSRVDRRRYLLTLARLPHPVFVEQALGVDEPQTNLQALVSEAPTAFDGHGRFLHAGCVVIALLRTAEVYLRRCAWEGGDAPVLYGAEDLSSIEAATHSAEAAIAPVLDALFRREDASSLAWAWLEHLIFQAEHRGYWRIDRPQGNGVALNVVLILIMRLAARLATRADFRDWIMANEDLWQIDRLTAVLAVGLWGSDSSAKYIEDCLNWALLELVIDYAGADQAILRTGGIVGNIGAACLLAQDDPAASFRALWHRSRPVRERLWRSTAGEDASQIHVAELLITWGMHAFEAAGGEHRNRLEQVLEGALCEASQTQSDFRYKGFWSGALHRFAKMLGLPGRDAHEELVQRLTAFLRPYTRPDALFLELILVLVDRQIDLPVIRLAISSVGVDLDWLVRAFFESEDKRIGQNIYQKRWVDRLRSLFPVVAQNDPAPAGRGAGRRTRGG